MKDKYVGYDKTIDRHIFETDDGVVVQLPGDVFGLVQAVKALQQRLDEMVDKAEEEAIILTYEGGE